MMLARSRRLLSAVLLVSWAIGTGVVWGQASDYQTAVSLVQQGQFDQSLPVLQRILDRFPNDLRARNLMGIALSGAGRREEANQQFKKVLALDPKFVPALKNLAVNEFMLGKVQDARAHFEEALKLAPRDPTSHWGLAEIEYAARNFERAATHYEQSGELAIRDTRTMVRFASSYVEIKQAVKAAALLERIPWDTDANTHFQVGLMLARLEKFEAAARRFELVRNGYPDPYQVGYNLVLVFVRKGDFAAAIRAGEEMLAGGQRKAELYNLLAQAYMGDGKTKEAYDSLRAATELDPLDETNYLDLILLCWEHENLDLSLEIADIGLRRLPTSHRLHLQRGAVLALRGQFEEAVKELQTAAQLAPDAGLSQVALGLVFLQMDKTTEAVDVLRRQSKRTPDDPYVLWFLGEALNRMGAAPGSETEKEAIASLEKSIRLNPRLPQSHALLGKMLLGRGEVQRAAQELEKALEMDPEDLTATYHLAQALQRRGDDARAKQLFEKVERGRSQEEQGIRDNLRRFMKARSR
jgi:tetratricopeptide (TPR) repeat protein